MFIYSHNSLGVFINFLIRKKKNNTTIFSVGFTASVASESSEAASAASASTTAASTLSAAVLSPDGSGCLLADPGGPGGWLGSLGWRLESASSPLPGLALQLLDLVLEHVDQQPESMRQRVHWIRPPDILSVVVYQGKAGRGVQHLESEVLEEGEVLEVDAGLLEGSPHLGLEPVLRPVHSVVYSVAAALI
jgi:hypothetical protein